MIAPAAVKFNTENYVFGTTYRSTMALKGYPPTTEDLALLYRLSEMSGVNIRLSEHIVHIRVNFYTAILWVCDGFLFANALQARSRDLPGQQIISVHRTYWPKPYDSYLYHRLSFVLLLNRTQLRTVSRAPPPARAAAAKSKNIPWRFCKTPSRQVRPQGRNRPAAGPSPSPSQECCKVCACNTRGAHTTGRNANP